MDVRARLAFAIVVVSMTGLGACASSPGVRSKMLLWEKKEGAYLEYQKSLEPNDKTICEHPWTGAGPRKPEWVEGRLTEEDYPVIAKKFGWSGRVDLTLGIDEAGSVDYVMAVQDDQLSESLVSKMQKARFKPAISKSGCPIKSNFHLPIRFESK